MNNIEKYSTKGGTPVTVAYGDGIGPEIMDATLHILHAAGAKLDLTEIEIGEKVYNRGCSAGIEDSAWDSLMDTKIFLKAPITTPQGGGFKSLNVTTRKTLGLYANIRPCRSYHPFIETKHPVMDVVIIRENEEDLYAGIEHQQTPEVTQSLKLISRPGCEKIIRYAFEYAISNGRKKVTAFSKDNIMKLTDGLFHKIFDEIAAEYPQIENEHWIVDIGAAKLADSPEQFDVIVMENLYGDILSDVAAQITGSVGLAGSANIGEEYAMFEAIHGSAPRRAGQNLANPTGLLFGAVMMLNHLGQQEVSERIHNAWLKVIEDGIHTYDIYEDGVSKQKVGTREFAEAVGKAAAEGARPAQYKAIEYPKGTRQTSKFELKKTIVNDRKCVGIDIFLYHENRNAEELGTKLSETSTDKLKLSMISNRGAKVWPDGFKQTFCTDHWRCRFKSENKSAISHQDIIDVLSSITKHGFDFIKTEGLYEFDGEPVYSKSQGE